MRLSSNKHLLTNSCVLSFVLCLFTTIGFSQKDTTALSRKEIRKQKRKSEHIYICLNAGATRSNYRDFGTSPLFFSGNGTNVTAALSKEKPKTTVLSSIDFSLAFHQSNSLYVTSSTSYVSRLEETRHWKTNRITSEKWPLELGYHASTILSFRHNPSLLNNSLGYELFFNIMASAKIYRELTRHTAKEIKVAFLKFKLKPKNRNISFSFKPGIFNNSLRNGYAYIGQSFLENDFQTFDDYRFYFFSGLRFITKLNYTKTLNNGNQIELSYKWDALRTGRREFHHYEWAQHNLSLGILFKTR